MYVHIDLLDEKKKKKSRISRPPHVNHEQCRLVICDLPVMFLTPEAQSELLGRGTLNSTPVMRHTNHIGTSVTLNPRPINHSPFFNARQTRHLVW